MSHPSQPSPDGISANINFFAVERRKAMDMVRNNFLYFQAFNGLPSITHQEAALDKIMCIIPRWYRQRDMWTPGRFANLLLSCLESASKVMHAQTRMRDRTSGGIQYLEIIEERAHIDSPHTPWNDADYQLTFRGIKFKNPHTLGRLQYVIKEMTTAWSASVDHDTYEPFCKLRSELRAFVLMLVYDSIPPNECSGYTKQNDLAFRLLHAPDINYAAEVVTLRQIALDENVKMQDMIKQEIKNLNL